MKIGICIKKFLIALSTLLILECESKTISVRVTHEENFVVQGGGDQDVVEMVDPELRSAMEKDLIYEELHYKASHEKVNNSHRNKDVNHLQHKTKGNPTKNTQQEREEHLKKKDSNQQNGQFDILDEVYQDSKSVLKTTDDYPESHQTSTDIYRLRGTTEQEKTGISQNMKNQFKHYKEKELMDEIKSVLKDNEMQRSRLKSSILKHDDRKSHIINKNKKDRLENPYMYNRTPFFSSNSNPTKTDVSDVLQKMQEIDKNDKRIEDQILPSVDLFDEEQRGGPQISRPPRVRRQVDINALADAHFENKNISSSETSRNHSDTIQVITDEDVDELNKRAEERRAGLLRYLGMTLVSVVGFSFICYCFIKDPKRCIALFGTGCPCCIVCMPCLKWYEKRIRAKIDVKAMMTENVNRYLPGCIIHDDGTVEAYEATQKEIDIAVEIIEIVNEN